MYSILDVKLDLILARSQFFLYLREILYKHALEHLEASGPAKKWVISFSSYGKCLIIIDKRPNWLGNIFGASASPRPLTKKLAMPPSSTVHGGQHDTKYVTFELLLHAAFVADEIWVLCLNQLVCFSY